MPTLRLPRFYCSRLAADFTSLDQDYSSLQMIVPPGVGRNICVKLLLPDSEAHEQDAAHDC
jgi:hypothetical protein